MCCGRCTSWLVLYFQTGATLRRQSLRAVAAAVPFVHVVAATSASCRSTSHQNIAFQATLQRHVSRAVAAGVSITSLLWNLFLTFLVVGGPLLSNTLMVAVNDLRKHSFSLSSLWTRKVAQETEVDHAVWPGY